MIRLLIFFLFFICFNTKGAIPPWRLNGETNATYTIGDVYLSYDLYIKEIKILPISDISSDFQVSSGTLSVTNTVGSGALVRDSARWQFTPTVSELFSDFQTTITTGSDFFPISTSGNGGSSSSGVTRLNESSTRRFSTGTSTNGYALGRGENAVFWSTDAPDTVRDLRFRMAVTRVAETGDDFYATIGWGDHTTSLNETDGIAIRHDGGTNVWRLVCTLNSTETIIDSTATVTANTWYTGRLVWDTTVPSVTAYVNGVPFATNTVNIPTTSARATGFKSGIFKTSGSSDSLFIIDYMHFIQTRSSPR